MKRPSLLIFPVVLSLMIAEPVLSQGVPAQGVSGQDKLAKATPIHPKIEGHGSVVQLPRAAHQPRSGTKLLVDVTRGGDPSK